MSFLLYAFIILAMIGFLLMTTSLTIMNDSGDSEKWFIGFVVGLMLSMIGAGVFAYLFCKV